MLHPNSLIFAVVNRYGACNIFGLGVIKGRGATRPPSLTLLALCIIGRFNTVDLPVCMPNSCSAA